MCQIEWFATVCPKFTSHDERYTSIEEWDSFFWIVETWNWCRMLIISFIIFIESKPKIINKLKNRIFFKLTLVKKVLRGQITNTINLLLFLRRHFIIYIYFNLLKSYTRKYLVIQAKVSFTKKLIAIFIHMNSPQLVHIAPIHKWLLIQQLSQPIYYQFLWKPFFFHSISISSIYY